MNIRRQKAALLFGAASLGIATNVSTSFVSADNESKDIKEPSKALNILLNFKNSIFNKLKNSISSVVSYLMSKLSNLNNEELYDIPDEHLADLWNEYNGTEQKYYDEYEKARDDKEKKEKVKEKYDIKLNHLQEKLSSVLVPYAKLFVNLENLELRMNEKNDKILITMKDDTTNNDKSMPLDFLCEVLHKMLSNFRGIDSEDYKKIADNCKVLRLLTKRKEQFLLLTGYERGEKLYSEISNIIDSISSNKKSNKDVVKYLKDSFKNLNTKDAYIKEVFGEKFKPHKVTTLEGFGRLKNHILEKIKSQESEDAKEIVEDFNLSSKELFPNKYENLLIKSQE